MSEPPLPVPVDHPAVVPPPNRPPAGVQAWQPELARRGAFREEEKKLSWERYLAALRRFKWLIGGFAVAGGAAGVVATRLVTPQYEAHATVWISSGSDKRQGGPLQANDPVQESSGWIELFRSLRVTDSIVMKHRLYLSHSPVAKEVFADFSVASTFRPGDYQLTVSPGSAEYLLTAGPERTTVERGAPGDSIGRSLGFLWAPPAASIRAARLITFSLATPSQASARLTARLTATLPEGSSFMQLTLVGTSPTEVATTLNDWVAEFIAMEADLKKEQVAQLTSILQSQVQLAGKGQAAAERALEAFQSNAIAQPSGGGVIGMAQDLSGTGGGVKTGADPSAAETELSSVASYTGLSSQRESLRQDIERLHELLADSAGDGGTLNPEDLLTIPSLATGSDNLRAAIADYTAKSGHLRELRQKYTDEYKAVRDTQQAVTVLKTQTIPQLARQSLNRLTASESAIDRRLQGSTASMRRLPGQTLQDARLRREYDQATQLYRTLQDRYEEARIAEASAIPDVRVLDRAVVPRVPSLNTAPRVLLMVTVGAFVVGIVLALALDRLDPRIRYPEQAIDDLGLPILGTVPGVRRRSGSAGIEQQAQIVESFRTIRLNLINLFEPGTPVMLTITSPGVGEGKSFVASNLALSFADSGYRTLLVDGDVRRGLLHETFGVKQSPGLMEYLTEQAALTEIIQPTNSAELTLVTGGARQHRAPELLASAGTLRFLSAARAQYDVIIVDSPPLGAGIDAFALGSATGSIMAVLRIGRSDRRMAEAKLSVLDRYPIRQLGAVLNDVNVGGAFRYYSYVPGYGIQEKEGIASVGPRMEVGRIAGPK